jgi:hypothetical protein
MHPSEFKQALENSQRSTAIKATRRILFNHLYETSEERGHFHVDQMFGSGSGILLKQHGTFYVLTANHVANNATKYEFANESPFWVPRSANQFAKELYDFLMPGQILHIGELIADQGHSIDTSDLILIEMFYPHPKHMPDQYIDLDARPDALLTAVEFFNGQLLQGAGYPFEGNAFRFHDETPEGFTHSTDVNRYIFDGYCVIENNEPFISAENLGTYPNLSGASGGIVTNVQPSGDDVKMAGMLVSAGPTIVRFIPSYLIADALTQKHLARSTKVDPLFLGQPPTELREWNARLGARSDHSDQS